MPGISIRTCMLGNLKNNPFCFNTLTICMWHSQILGNAIPFAFEESQCL